MTPARYYNIMAILFYIASCVDPKLWHQIVFLVLVILSVAASLFHDIAADRERKKNGTPNP